MKMLKVALILLAAAAVGALGLGTSAEAQPQGPTVMVANVPLPVSKIDEPGRIPYQVSVQGQLPLLPAVPAGRRLVIESVSVRQFVTGTALGMMKINVHPTGQFFLPMTFAGTGQAGNLWVAHAPTTIHVDPGMPVQFLPELAPLATAAISATVSGYLLECSTALPCDPIAP